MTTTTRDLSLSLSLRHRPRSSRLLRDPRKRDRKREKTRDDQRKERERERTKARTHNTPPQSDWRERENCWPLYTRWWLSTNTNAPSSFVVMVPSPSLSNKANASLNSVICSSVSSAAISCVLLVVLLRCCRALKRKNVKTRAMWSFVVSGASLNWKKNFSKKSVEQSRVFGAFWEILKNLHIYTTYDGVWQSVCVCVCVCCKKYVSLCFFPRRWSTPFPFFVHQHEPRGPPRTSSSPSSSEIKRRLVFFFFFSLSLSLFFSLFFVQNSLLLFFCREFWKRERETFFFAFFHWW